MRFVTSEIKAQTYKTDQDSEQNLDMCPHSLAEYAC